MKSSECPSTLSWETPGRVHMMGVCGVGMAGVAYLLVQRGWRVDGCDAHLNRLAEWLRRVGVEVTAGHDPRHLSQAERVIITPAVAATEPERMAACSQGLPVFRRGEVLAALVSQGRGVAVCGAHGKTTTSCFTARLLQELDAEPGWCIGGATRRLGGVAGGGSEVRNAQGARCTVNLATKDDRILVAEADESDGTLALYAPAVTVVTNIDLDHLEHFDGEAGLTACFQSVVSRTREGVAICCDNARARQVAKEASVPVLTFGFSDQAELQACDLRTADGRVSFELAWRGTSWGRVTLGILGRHNVLNALGAASAALLLGYEPDAVFAALPQACDELPARRFETVAEVLGCRFVADYAHHPVELKAAVEMAREQHPGRLVAVFQPHRYTRTLALGADFPGAFAAADEVILLPVYAASEAPIEGGESCDLYEHFREWDGSRFMIPEGGVKPEDGCVNVLSLPVDARGRIKLARSLEETWSYLRQTVKAGDVVLIAGAGDVIGLVELIRADMARGWPVRNAPEGFEEALVQVQGAAVTAGGDLADWSYFGVGGRAQWRVEVSDEPALGAVVRLCAGHGVAWRMVGAGANAWFSDLGEPGCVIRFAPGAFKALSIDGGDVTVGCGWMGPALLGRLEQEGLSGLECLDSVPGTLGGWLAMNAGAHGGEIGARVTWIRCLNPDGEISILQAKEIGFAYRHCASLTGCVALACGLRLEQSTPAAVKALRCSVRAKRIPLSGLRTEGSVFRNPAGDSAGRLLEQAGCKGLRIGGAYVTALHANIVAVDEAATASDVLALAMKMRRRVASRCGALLSPEIGGLIF